MRVLGSIVLGLAVAAVPLGAQQRTAQATLVDESGERIGEVRLTETPESGVLLQVRLEGAPEGTHAIHIHETGACEPTFDAAGDHFAPEDDGHGFLSQQGVHAGDLTNLTIPADGGLEEERLAPDVTLEPDGEGSLLDGDGSAIVIHQGVDDYASQPSGGAGEPIICGVVRG